MPSADDLKQRIETALPGSTAQVEDLTGGGDHFRAEVTSDRFEGLSRIEQHQLVYGDLRRRGRRPDPRPLHQDLDPSGRHPVTDEEIRDFISNAIDENPVMLFMKGTPQQPACGFSARTAGALNALGVQYAALDILPDPRIRQELSGMSGWPTIPQLFVEGELIGGADIVAEMYETGELAEKLGADQPQEPEAAVAETTPERKAPPMQLENRLD